MAYPPVKTPVLSGSSATRSISDLRAVASIYACTSAVFSPVVTRDTSGCSGAKTINVAPKSVSGRVVNTCSESPDSVLKTTSAPSLRPIQLTCARIVSSGQSRSLSPSINSSAYSVILKNHCVSSRLVISLWPRQSVPSALTSSFASAPQTGHHHCNPVARYAKPRS